MSDRERRRGKGRESGGTEGSRGGDGGGDGGKASTLGGDGKGFSFGCVDKSKTDGRGVKKGNSPSQQNGSSSFSYRDKLLAPGCGGFLVNHSEEDDIVKGWRYYFHKMNGKEPRRDVEESDEENNPMEARLEGKPERLSFSAEEYMTWCLPWMNSLTSKSWEQVSQQDREYAFQEGPWMIEDHYLIVQRWRPNFNPWKADFQCVIAAWVRLPDVPFEFYNVESLRRIGNMIGKMIKVDRSTSIYDKGGFARICVEIDLKQELLPTYLVFGEERPIIYEGLHNVFLLCGKYGHQKADCPLVLSQPSTQVPEQNEVGANTGTNGEPTMESIPSSGSVRGEKVEKVPSMGKAGGNSKETSSGNTGGTSVVTREADAVDSPFGKLRLLRRAFRGFSYSDRSRKGFNRHQSQIIDQKIDEDKRDSRKLGTQSDTLRMGTQSQPALHTSLNGIKGEESKSKGTIKSEWV
ncbi:hypothetical protein K1719_016024 [Acacia pycnantha]|nr:hypothetical protein K1719_016024 [Acacia pycnantha]